MKKMFFDIVETLGFLVVLYFIAIILTKLNINYNVFYIFIGLLIIWVVVKMTLIENK